MTGGVIISVVSYSTGYQLLLISCLVYVYISNISIFYSFTHNKSYMISVPQSPTSLPVFGSYLTTTGDVLVSHSSFLRPTFETIVS